MPVRSGRTLMEEAEKKGRRLLGVHLGLAFSHWHDLCKIKDQETESKVKLSLLDY